MADILTSNKNGLKLFENGVEINEGLTKWKNAKKGTAPNGNTYFIPETLTSASNDGTPIPWEISTPESRKGDTSNLSEIASMELAELNKYVNDKGLTFILTKTGRYGASTLTFNSVVEGNIDYVGGKSKSKLNLGKKIKLFFTKKEKPEMDIISFFTKVKATSKESANGYKNRVEKYLTAIHNAKIIGQTALVEKLTRELIANKYESFLAAEGYYHVVTEEQAVDFIKRSERGISLDYLKNFIRPIPSEVVDKIAKADALEVFDNYVILHYDPKGTSRQDTAKEEAKKRDPIVFGVIAGSTKLYYITDWIDDYCNLTLEKFVDTLGITKDDLIEDEEEKKKANARKELKKLDKIASKKAPEKDEKKKNTRKKNVKKEK